MAGAKVKIVNNETGQVAYYYDKTFSVAGEFIWTEGAYACDCNRELLFGLVLGVNADKRDCGVTGFTVPYAELPDGTIVNLDGEN